jgi:hypothetical protein
MSYLETLRAPKFTDETLVPYFKNLLTDPGLTDTDPYVCEILNKQVEWLCDPYSDEPYERNWEKFSAERYRKRWTQSVLFALSYTMLIRNYQTVSQEVSGISTAIECIEIAKIAPSTDEFYATHAVILASIGLVIFGRKYQEDPLQKHRPEYTQYALIMEKKKSSEKKLADAKISAALASAVAATHRKSSTLGVLAVLNVASTADAYGEDQKIGNVAASAEEIYIDMLQTHRGILQRFEGDMFEKLITIIKQNIGMCSPEIHEMANYGIESLKQGVADCYNKYHIQGVRDALGMLSTCGKTTLMFADSESKNYKYGSYDDEIKKSLIEKYGNEYQNALSIYGSIFPALQLAKKFNISCSWIDRLSSLNNEHENIPKNYLNSQRMKRCLFFLGGVFAAIVIMTIFGDKGAGGIIGGLLMCAAGWEAIFLQFTRKYYMPKVAREIDRKALDLNTSMSAVTVSPSDVKISIVK